MTQKHLLLCFGMLAPIAQARLIAADETEKDYHVVAVDFPSSERPLTSQEVLDGYELREAVSLALKLKGVPVMVDGFLPPALQSSEHRPTESAARGAMTAICNRVVTIRHLPNKGGLELILSRQRGLYMPSEVIERWPVSADPAEHWKTAVTLAEKMIPPIEGKLRPVPPHVAEAIITGADVQADGIGDIPCNIPAKNFPLSLWAPILRTSAPVL